MSGIDLKDLDSDLPNASALEEANALALAIIPDGKFPLVRAVE